MSSRTSLRGWSRLWVVVAVFATSRVLRSLQVGIPLRDPHGAIFLTRVGAVGRHLRRARRDRRCSAYDGRAGPSVPSSGRCARAGPGAGWRSRRACSSPTTSCTSATTT